MLDFWSKKKKQHLEDAEGTEHLYVEYDEAEGNVTIVNDSISDPQAEVSNLEFMSQHNNIPTFKGEVKHAYESAFLGYMDTCPRCDSPTERRMSNFPYATDGAARIMTAPVGLFCTKCPTVIFDDEMAQRSIRSGVVFRGIVGLETGYQGLQMFSTFNGKKPTYLLTLEEDAEDVEDAEIGGIRESLYSSEEDGMQYIASEQKRPVLTRAKQKRKQSNKQKNRAARKARKRNRRK